MAQTTALGEKRMGLSASRKEDYNKLILAIQRGDLDDIEELLSTGLKINKPVDSTSLLYNAVEGGHVNVVKLLINCGSDVNIGRINDSVVANLMPSTMYEIDSPLHLACKLGHVDIVLELLSCGVDVNRTNQYGMTTVWKMAAEGKHDMLKLLLRHPNVDVALPSGDNCIPQLNSHTTPLIMAARESHDAVATLLCQHPSNDVNRADTQGRTALHYAAFNGNDQMTAMLLWRGAKIDSVDEDRVTPLYTACKHGHTDIVKRLLVAGADTSIAIRTDSSNNGFSPLHIAVFQGHMDVVRLLCDFNPEMIDMSTAKEKTPLILACYAGRRDVVLFLLQRGANSNVTDAFHQTPLLYALSHGIQAEASKSIFNDDKNDKVPKDQIRLDDVSRNQSPFSLYNEFDLRDDINNNDDISILELLIRHGADVNTLDIHQRSVGFYSITKGTLPQCVMMMKYGADIHPFDIVSFSKMANCDKLKALIQIDLRFRNVAKMCCKHQDIERTLERSLEHELTNPPSLKVQCRHVIRKTLLLKQNGALHKQTQELPIPKLLKWYILLNDVCNQFDVASKYT
ncbi:serine/threonine-protein phosphatase 6 regulatory ankyrin repeat subunit A-like [Ylistrum balloti]|uniref:serine/threonine-protein phosphatase 6 regulatory ankyrin repeat subunit A-like n=1 Tax=Ylistrum balloti TaxID=509963 RepID=UPI002905A9DB|nr:serine/threonine-protein phosphatase 6 regulatory ankyrin repeat subunit A-like [Ylistrum balloti]